MHIVRNSGPYHLLGNFWESCGCIVPGNVSSTFVSAYSRERWVPLGRLRGDLGVRVDAADISRALFLGAMQWTPCTSVLVPHLKKLAAVL